MRSFDRDNFYKCPSPLLRVNDELRHNPYVGSFHGVSRPSEAARNKTLSIHNPHLGTMRHSPAAGSFPVKLNLGFKGLLYDDGPFKPAVLSQVQLSCTRQLRLHLTPNCLSRIPTFTFCQASNNAFGTTIPSSDAPSCAICLEAFTDGCELRNLACQHCFHKKCVDTWLCGQHSEESQRTAICPTCRCDAVSINDGYNNGDRSRAESNASLISHETKLETAETVETSDEQLKTESETSTDSGVLHDQGTTRSDAESTLNMSGEIPEDAFVNVGRYLYAHFTGSLPANSSPAHTNNALSAEDIADLYEAIPDIQDDSMLGSTYDLCGVGVKAPQHY